MIAACNVKDCKNKPTRAYLMDFSPEGKCSLVVLYCKEHERLDCIPLSVRAFKEAGLFTVELSGEGKVK